MYISILKTQNQNKCNLIFSLKCKCCIKSVSEYRHGTLCHRVQAKYASETKQVQFYSYITAVLLKSWEIYKMHKSQIQNHKFKTKITSKSKQHQYTWLTNWSLINTLIWSILFWELLFNGLYQLVIQIYDTDLKTDFIHSSVIFRKKVD